MIRGRPWGFAILSLCLVAGFAVSFVKAPRWIRTSAAGSAPTSGTTATSSASRSRALHLEYLWAQRRGTFQTTEASQRVLAAASSGKWDETAKKEALTLLIRDPSFINTIWNKAAPATRDAMISELIKTMVDANPSTALEVLDEGKFDFSKIPEIGYLMSRTVRYGRSPIDALDAAKRNRAKLGQEAFAGMLSGAGHYEESARVMLADVALGDVYPQREIDNACAALLRKDGELPAGTANLDSVKAFLARKAAADQTTAWLTEGKAATADELRNLDARGVSEAISDVIWDEGKTIDAAKLELLAAAGHGEQQSGILYMMIEAGRTGDALRLLDEVKDLPASKQHRDELISTVVTAVYDSAGDVGEACRLMESISDDPVYWKSMKEVLTNWVTDDPEAGRAYLEQVTDPELRRSLEEALTKSSLDP